jgi:Brp/Blh family beta-carotene 15,15'-monooxygenase
MSSPDRQRERMGSRELGDEGIPLQATGRLSSISRQGLAFSALAWLALLSSLWLPPFGVQAQLLMLSPVILVLGVPHGALDVVFARRLLGVESLGGWALFTIAYFAAAASVVLLWWLAPGSFLVAFLLISAFHFSGDPAGRTPTLLRVLYGGAIIFCPLALHAAEVSQLFAFLVGGTTAQAIVAVLHRAAWFWVVSIGVASIPGLRTLSARSIELVSLAALLTFAPPLVAFTLFFCAMHSARHVLRTRDYSMAGTFSSLVRLAIGPMLVTVAFVAVAVSCSRGMPLDLRLAKVLFVGLAALTVPHMILVERVRLSGWVTHIHR